MKSTMFKFTAAIALMATSAVAFAANGDCCGSFACCVKMLACCF